MLEILRRQAYDIMAPTPASHAWVLARGDRRIGTDVDDLLGWSVPCRIDALPTDVVELLSAADLLDLGPDSYRFADYILRNVAGLRAGARIPDYGAGAGVGGITAAADCEGAVLTLADINPKALFLASVNATAAAVEHRCVRAETPAKVEGAFDLIVTHPPFMMDPDRRAYRDGGGLHGGRLSLDWTVAAIAKLAPGSRFLMHTGASCVGERDVLRDAITGA